MGDQNNYNTADISQLKKALDEIIALLRQPQSRVEVGGDANESIFIIGQNNMVPLSRKDVEAFAKLQTNADAAFNVRSVLSLLHRSAPMAGE